MLYCDSRFFKLKKNDTKKLVNNVNTITIVKNFAIKLLENLSDQDRKLFYHIANAVIDDVLMGHRDRDGKIKNPEQTKKALDYCGYYKISDKLFESQQSLVDHLLDSITLYRSLTLDDLVFKPGDKFVDVIPTSYTYSKEYVYDFSMGNDGVKVIVDVAYPTHLQFIPLPPHLTRAECEVVLPPMTYKVVDVSESDFGDNYFNMSITPKGECMTV